VIRTAAELVLIIVSMISLILSLGLFTGAI